MNRIYNVIAHMSDMGFHEQEAKCNEYGIDLNLWAKEVQVHFFDSDFHSERKLWMTPHEALDALAIKGNVDLVRFHNGNLGFVAMYGEILNGFEIIQERKLDYKLVTI